MILARAAARTPTLEHYIWATLPHAFNLSGTRCYHMDCKAQVDQRIREELPDLAAKTTYLYCGLYPSTLTGVLMPFEAVSLASFYSLAGRHADCPESPVQVGSMSGSCQPSGMHPFPLPAT